MSLGTLNLYHADGRLCGSYVYLLLCHDGGPVYVKVGVSDRPTARLQALKQGCPVMPREFCFFEVRSRHKARQIELAVLARLAQWAARGEWFRVELADRAPFNAQLRAAIDPHREGHWPCHWQRVSIPALEAHERHRAAGFVHWWRRQERAWHDAEREHLHDQRTKFKVRR